MVIRTHDGGKRLPSVLPLQFKRIIYFCSQVLAELGYSADEIARLREDKVI